MNKKPGIRLAAALLSILVMMAATPLSFASAAEHTYTIEPIADQIFENKEVNYYYNSQEIEIEIVKSGTGNLSNLTVEISGSSFEVMPPSSETILDAATPSVTFRVKATYGLLAGDYEEIVTIHADNMLPVQFKLKQKVVDTFGIRSIDDERFDPLQVGYEDGSQEEREIYIYNDGSGDLTNLKVEASNDSFVVSALEATELSNEHRGTYITVKAMTGLPVGEHTTTFTVTSKEADDVSFTVTQPVGIAAPALTADTTDNDRNHDITVTFRSNANWQAAIQAVGVLGDGIDWLEEGSDYEITNGKITFKKDVLWSGENEIIIRANGYVNARVIQEIVPPFVGDRYTISTLVNIPQLNGYDGSPNQMALDEKRGYLYVSAYYNNTGAIYRIDLNNNNKMTRFVGGDCFTESCDNYTPSGSISGKLANESLISFANSITVDKDGTLYFTELGSYLVRKVDQNGQIVDLAGELDEDNRPVQLRKFSDITEDTPVGGPALGAALYQPGGIAVSDGNVYFVDYLKLYKIDQNGILTNIELQNTIAHTENLQVINGELYIAEYNNHVIRKIDLSSDNNVKSVEIVAGILGGYGFSGEGEPATEAKFSYPYGLSMDGAGNLYIADTYSSMVRKVKVSDGTIARIAGNGIYGYSGDNGPAHQARMIRPNDTEVTADGIVYVSDSGNGVIRVLKPEVITPPSTGGGTSGPSTETITIDVEDGSKDSGSVVSKATIDRTTDASGKKKDNVTLTKEQASRSVEQLKASGSNTAKIVIPDKKDEVSEVNVMLPKATTDTFATNGMNLEINTPNARVILPNKSLQGLTDDAYFRFVPIKTESERLQVEQRARTEQIVRIAAGTDKINVVGRPMTIETNMQSREVTLVLPLGDVSFTEEQLKDLGIFIEHSDGTKEFIKGEIVPYDASGMKGIRFTINKFSTFTVIHKEGWQQTLLEGEGNQTHDPYIIGFPNSTFGPEKPITREEIATILSRVLTKDETVSSKTFKDIDDKRWSSAAIEKVTKMGLMIGYEDGNFRPKQTITRAEMAEIVARLITAETKGKGYSDVAAQYWAADAIKKAQAAGLMEGYIDGTFRPKAQLTRAEAVTLMNRLLGRGPVTGINAKWSDVTAKHWAFGDIQEASIRHRFEGKSEVTEQRILLP